MRNITGRGTEEPKLPKLYYHTHMARSIPHRRTTLECSAAGRWERLRHAYERAYISEGPARRRAFILCHPTLINHTNKPL